MSCLQQVARHLLRRLTSRNARIFLRVMGMAQLSARLHYAGLQLHLFPRLQDTLLSPLSPGFKKPPEFPSLN